MHFYGVIGRLTVAALRLAEKYSGDAVEQARMVGATGSRIAAPQKETSEMMAIYKRPLANVGITFPEPLPVGLVVSPVPAALLGRGPAQRSGGAAS